MKTNKKEIIRIIDYLEGIYHDYYANSTLGAKCESCGEPMQEKDDKFCSICVLRDLIKELDANQKEVEYVSGGEVRIGNGGDIVVTYKGIIQVSVRWWDGYLEEFEATETRSGSDLLWMRLANGSNRHIPLRQVRWFSLDPESHARSK